MEEPIRAELFGVERLKPQADSLPAAQAVFSEQRLYPLLTPRVLENSRVLLESCRIIARAIHKEHAICCWPSLGKKEAGVGPSEDQQDMLDDMVGTIWFRVSFFMNKFRKQGVNDCNRELHVHSAFLIVILHD